MRALPPLAPVLAGLLAAALLPACGDPRDAEGWARRAADRSRMDEKLHALEQVRRAPGDRRAAVPHLVRVLGQAPRVRAQAALALGEIGDPAAAGPLVAAVDVAAKDRDGHEANRQIAGALGALRAREAVPRLVELTRAADPFTQVAAVDALGRIRDPAAVEPLSALALDPAAEPVVAKKALVALGAIADPRAAHAVLEMLFEERPGVSFFPEAAFAASQLGGPVAAPLLAVLDGAGPPAVARARERGVPDGLLVARAVQVLGDVGDPAVVPALVRKLAWSGDARLAGFVKAFSADALARLRAAEAVAPLSAALAREPDPAVRARFAAALGVLGDPAALPALRAAAASPDAPVREAAAEALSRLGGPADRPVVDAARVRDCAGGCPDRVARAFEGMRDRLAAAEACAAGGPGCWAGKLGASSPAVRDRAALEVGRTGGAGEAAALADAIVRPVATEEDLAARQHAVLALGWLSARAAPADAEALAGKVETVVAAERGRVVTATVNEDAWRLAYRLRRAGGR
jgi:HEAT repeat protein